MGDAFVDRFSPNADEFSVWPFLASAHGGHCVHTSTTAHCCCMQLFQCILAGLLQGSAWFVFISVASASSPQEASGNIC